MYRYTDHAKNMMKARKIIKEDVERTVEHGELEFTKIDEKGRGKEYTHSMILKDPLPRKVMVGWTHEGEDILILTVYEVKRRWR